MIVGCCIIRVKDGTTLGVLLVLAHAHIDPALSLLRQTLRAFRCTFAYPRGIAAPGVLEIAFHAIAVGRSRHALRRRTTYPLLSGREHVGLHIKASCFELAPYNHVTGDSTDFFFPSTRCTSGAPRLSCSLGPRGNLWLPGGEEESASELCCS